MTLSHIPPLLVTTTNCFTTTQYSNMMTIWHIDVRSVISSRLCFQKKIVEEIHIKHKPIHYRDPTSYTKVFHKFHMLEDSRKFFEVSCDECICMRTNVKSNKINALFISSPPFYHNFYFSYISHLGG